MPRAMISAAHGALPSSEFEKSTVRASEPVTQAAPSPSSCSGGALGPDGVHDVDAVCRVDAHHRAPGVARPRPACRSTRHRRCRLPPTPRSRRLPALSVTSATRGLVASGNRSERASRKACCVDDAGRASTLVLASRSDASGLPSSTSSSAQAIVTIAGCRCTRRVSLEKNPSSGAMSPNRATTAADARQAGQGSGAQQPVAREAEQRGDQGEGGCDGDDRDGEGAQPDRLHDAGLEDEQAERRDRERDARVDDGAPGGLGRAPDRREPALAGPGRPPRDAPRGTGSRSAVRSRSRARGRRR